jgi:hypothetical protein
MEHRVFVPDPGKLCRMMEEIQLPGISDEDFLALQVIVNYARSQVRCSLANAKAYAIRQGCSEECVDKAVRFWAKYEGNKR